MADWIKSAIKHPGAFSAKAKRAGESTAAYAAEKAHAPGALGRQARLAQTLMGMHKHADGAVVAPQQSNWERLWRMLTGKTTQEQLQKAAGTAPPMTPREQADISYVRKAAEEAGRRNEESKNAQEPVKKYGCGGVVMRQR